MTAMPLWLASLLIVAAFCGGVYSTCYVLAKQADRTGMYGELNALLAKMRRR